MGAEGRFEIVAGGDGQGDVAMAHGVQERDGLGDTSGHVGRDGGGDATGQSEAQLHDGNVLLRMELVVGFDVGLTFGIDQR